MSAILEIESAIEQLPSAECHELLVWFKKYLSTASVDSVSQKKKEKLSGFEILGDLVGSIKNAPSDLSSNKKYLANYGKENS